MNFSELIKQTRSYRRFDESHKVSTDLLLDTLELARYCPSPMNMQPLKYVVVTDENKCSEVFNNLAWAAYLKDWKGPEDGEKPSGYIVMLGDSTKKAPFINWDYGIVLQAIMLALMDKGYGSCPFAAFKKEKVREILDIPETLEVKLVIAVGKSVEKIVVDDVKDDDIKYWRDKDEVHHVPKRKLDELVFKVVE